MFIYRAIKHYKELWRVEGRVGPGRLKNVRAEAAIKTVRERISDLPLRSHFYVALNYRDRGKYPVKN
jgi:hypothetical protein